MFSVISSNRWTRSISAAAITVVGIFGSIPSPAVAQTTCTTNINTGTEPLPGPVPARVRTAAQNAANAALNPDPRLTRYDIEDEDTGRVYELRGRQSNGCQVEIDVLAPNRVEEIEVQLAALSGVPAAVRNRLNATLPASSFRVGFIERSQRPQPPKAVPPLTGIATFYEIEGTCTRAIANICTAGQVVEATINSNGTTIETEVAS